MTNKELDKLGDQVRKLSDRRDVIVSLMLKDTDPDTLAFKAKALGNINNELIPALDKLTRSVSAFDTFWDLMETNRNYTPSIYSSRGLAYEVLANEYDKAMERKGDSRRAWRGSNR